VLARSDIFTMLFRTNQGELYSVNRADYATDTEYYRRLRELVPLSQTNGAASYTQKTTTSTEKLTKELLWLLRTK
jgi:flagellum-specific peptidoglycan hydrolase FlgJ